jgi:hypothetical protein
LSQALPFSPLANAVTVGAGNGATSASTTLPGVGGDTCKVTNLNTVPVTIAFATVAGGATAIANGLVVNTGLTEIFSIPQGTTDVAAYGIGAAGNVVFQRGSGM